MSDAERVAKILRIIREAVELAGDSIAAFRRIMTERVEEGDLDDAVKIFEKANDLADDFIASRKKE